jgi:integrase
MASDFVTYKQKRKGSTPRYMRWIPTDLQPLFNGKKARTKLLTATPASEVAEVVRALQVQDDRLFKWLRQRTPDQRAAIVKVGGYDVAVRVARNLADPNVPDDHIPEEYLLSDEGLEEIDPAVHDAVRLGMLAQLREQRAEAVQRQALKSLVLVAEPAPEFSLDGLFSLWRKVFDTKRTDQHERTLKRFKAFVGPVDYRTVTAAQCAAFCKHLEDTGSTKKACVHHLDALRGMFKAALIKGIIPANPARGIKPDGRIEQGKREPFTGAELARILALAESTRFGDDRHEGVIWALRLLCWTGARVGEVFQLRKADVGTDSGVPFIHIRTGHPLQTVKAGTERRVPLHKDVVGFIEYAKNAPGEFIFGEFTHNSEKGRALWLIQAFKAFRRDACRITDDGKVLHSIRMRFHDVLDNAGVPLERQRVLVGHAKSDVHARYKRGNNLKLLAADVARLEPFAD